jgi:hypothetical protein
MIRALRVAVLDIFDQAFHQLSRDEYIRFCHEIADALNLRSDGNDIGNAEAKR